MNQLVAEGIFMKDEGAEIVFSDTTVVCVPDKNKE